MIAALTPGAAVRAYSIGWGRTFPGVVTEVDAGNGVWVRTDGRPDGDGPSYYPARFVYRDPSTIGIGSDVEHLDRETGETLRGTVVAADVEHYHATVNGVAVWIVDWIGYGPSTGWRSDDLQVPR